LFFATAAQAQEVEESETTSTTETTVVKEATDATESEVTEAPMQTEDFKMVEASELPEAVTAAIATDFEGATTNEVYVKEKEGKMIYKIKLDMNGVEKKVYADADGNWIKKEDKKDESY
jgi:hypothetical protein